MLVVDDNQFMRSITKTVLSAFHCRNIREAENGVQALEVLRGGFSPDIIITNWNMPEMDGITFAHNIRSDPDSVNPYTPIVMVTGHSEQHRVLAALNAGINEFLVKPVTAKGLYSRLAAVILRPRPFVRAKDFFGPDRRRRHDAAYRGRERRKSHP
ncbi:MAG: response regulator [Magnetospirillum sp. WYHS-4]